VIRDPHKIFSINKNTTTHRKQSDNTCEKLHCHENKNTNNETKVMGGKVNYSPLTKILREQIGEFFGRFFTSNVMYLKKIPKNDHLGMQI
jgi:hypothetical protein